MQYIIEYEETIKKVNSITIEVESEEKGDEIAEELAGKEGWYDHPDDIIFELDKLGVKIVERCEGAEKCSHEIW